MAAKIEFDQMVSPAHALIFQEAKNTAWEIFLKRLLRIGMASTARS